MIIKESWNTHTPTTDYEPYSIFWGSLWLQMFKKNNETETQNMK